jgi:hypothetical protein
MDIKYGHKYSSKMQNKNIKGIIKIYWKNKKTQLRLTGLYMLRR